MSKEETFTSRLEIEPDFNPAVMAGTDMVLAAGRQGLTSALLMGLVCIGAKRINWIVPDPDAGWAYTQADNAIRHVGIESELEIDVTPVGMLYDRCLPAGSVVLMDTGNPAFDEIEITGRFVGFASGRDISGEFIAVGSNPAVLRSCRSEGVMEDRAEMLMAAGHLLVGAIQTSGACRDVDPLPGIARIPVSPLPDRAGDGIGGHETILVAGAGAVFQNIALAESMDTVLRQVNSRTTYILIDPKSVHESARSRQMAFGPETNFHPKASACARWLERLFPGVRTVAYDDRKLSPDIFHKHSPALCISSVDNYAGRKVLAGLCDEGKTRWFSNGVSFFGGYCRMIDPADDSTVGAFDGAERLSVREDDDNRGFSCSAPETPLPSSIIPHYILGGWVASRRRDMLLGKTREHLGRGIEIHLRHSHDREAAYRGLRYSPGRRVNIR